MKSVVWWVGKLDKFNGWFINLGVFSLFAMMVIDTLNIIGAKFGVSVIPAGKTFIEELMTVVVFVGLGYVLFNQGHIKTEIVKNYFPPVLRFLGDVLSYGVIAIVSGIISWRNGVTAIVYIRDSVTSPADIPVPMGPFVLLIALSFFNLSLCSVLLLVKKFTPKEV